MSATNLEDVLQGTSDLVGHFRNQATGAFAYPVVPAEFTNWRDEQAASQKTAVITDQSHHMSEMLVRGPDAKRLLSSLAVNSMEKFTPNRAKQFAPCSPDGFVIGDGIMFYLAENEFNLVGRPPMMNWVKFHAETGGFDVEVALDPRSPSRTFGKPVVRRHYRYQVQGPNAPQILEKLNGGPLPEIKFFHMGEVNIAGRKVRALRHGMAGEPGLEFWGPYEEGEEVRAAILEAGKDFGLTEFGSRAYATHALESGWIPTPVPAIYTGDELKAYREWLPATGYEATASIGGSYVGATIDDYYLTPYEMGYGSFIKFDHDFVGRKALEELQGQKQRKKVTFVWDPKDVAKIFASLVDPSDLPYKFLELPLSTYASSTYDKVMNGGSLAGFSMFTGYSHNERAVISVGVVDHTIDVGDTLTLVWGEEDGGTRKPTVERHRQLEVRVEVAPAPFTRDARETYAEGWRTRAA